MAWIEKRKIKGGEAYYVIDRDKNGKRISRPAGPVHQTAKDIKRTIENTIAQNGGKSNNLNVALKVAYDEYEVLITKTRAKRTWRIYKWGIDKLLDFFTADQKVSEISKPDIIKFRAKIMQAHNINGMMDILKYVRTFFSFCIQSGYIQINPASGALRGLKAEDVAHFLSTEEIRHILSHCLIPDMRDIIKLALMTGMREEEIATMKSSWIKNHDIHVLGKGSKYRAVPIVAKLRPILNARLSTGDTAIFPGWNVGRIRQAWKRIIHRARKTMPLGRTRFHDLRHTFASNFLQDGGRLESLKLILGHASIATTMQYTHLQQSHLTEQMDKMKAEFMEATPPEFRVA